MPGNPFHDCPLKPSAFIMTLQFLERFPADRLFGRDTGDDARLALINHDNLAFARGSAGREQRVVVVGVVRPDTPTRRRKSYF
jgi:hypothetical protein